MELLCKSDLLTLRQVDHYTPHPPQVAALGLWQCRRLHCSPYKALSMSERVKECEGLRLEELSIDSRTQCLIWTELRDLTNHDFKSSAIHLSRTFQGR